MINDADEKYGNWSKRGNIDHDDPALKKMQCSAGAEGLTCRESIKVSPQIAATAEFFNHEEEKRVISNITLVRHEPEEYKGETVGNVSLSTHVEHEEACRYLRLLLKNKGINIKERGCTFVQSTSDTTQRQRKTFVESLGRTDKSITPETQIEIKEAFRVRRTVKEFLTKKVHDPFHKDSSDPRRWPS